MQTIYLAGGCFWGVQKFLDQFDGVKETVAGYANGPDKAPTYKEVCSDSGHAETVKVVFDEKTLPLKKLLRWYFRVIDPTAVNRQGNDAGIQYRTGIYYTDDGQQPDIREVCEEIIAEVMVPLAVEVGPLRNFFPAEEYHQKYLDNNPGGYCHVPAALFHLQDEEKAAGETPEGLKDRIGDLAYEVTQNAVTEQPFTGEYDSLFERGLYVDVVSGEPLFSSSDKFDSGCGWPAFARTIEEDTVKENIDTSYGRIRTEVRSAKSGSHLGHVFNDGPASLGGVRYCINSAALRFIPYDDLEKEGYGEWKEKIK